MDEVMTCKGRAYFAFIAAMAGGSIVFALCAVSAGSLVLILISGAMVIGTGLSAVRTCHTVDLYPNGQLVLHHLQGRRTIRVEAILSITLDRDPDGESPDQFIVKYDGGRFNLSANGSCRLLVDSLLRLRPGITVEGYASSS
jgi:hypothetical protein